MAKSKKNKNKSKLNLTVRDEQRNKLEQMASLENRSVSNLVEVMADERWDRLVEQQGVAYAQTVAGAMNLKLDVDNPADRVARLARRGSQHHIDSKGFTPESPGTAMRPWS